MQDTDKSNNVTETSSNLRKLIIVTFESVSIFVLSYLLISIINSLAIYALAKLYGLECELRYFGIHWITPPSSSAWTRENIIIIFLAGPVFSLIFSGLLFKLFLVAKRWHYLVRLFFAWSFFHCIVYFIGAYIAGVISKDGFWFASTWIGTHRLHELIISVFCVVAAALIGIFILHMFVSAASSNSLIGSKNLKEYIFHQVVLPWIIGGVILGITKLPSIKLYETIILCSYILFFTLYIVGSSKTILRFKNIKIRKQYHLTNFNLTLGILTFLLLLVFRYLLS